MQDFNSTRMSARLARLSEAARRVSAQGRRLASAPVLDAARLRLKSSTPSLGADLLAGAVASLVAIAYCISFSALLFQGDLQGGLALGLWALLAGSALIGLYVAVTTTLPPAGAGPDNPAVAVMSVLAATVSAPILVRGGSPELAVGHVLLAMTLATLVTGLVLYLLGRFRLGQLVRFVPYPVIGGFLAASGWLLITGGIEVVTGIDFNLVRLGATVPMQVWPQIAVAFAFAAAVFALRKRTRSVFVLPGAFFGASLLIDLVFWSRGGMSPASGWYLAGSSQMQPWVPIAAVLSPDIDWMLFLKASAEIGSVAAVTVLALLLDVTSLEVARAKTADLDAEFRNNGLANIVVAPLGGLLANLSLNASRLLEEAGGRTFMSGVYASLAIGLILVTGLDLPRFVPAPILAGLLVYLGCLVLVETLLRSPAHRAWTDLALALAIMIAIVQFGYFSGVVLGFVGACLMFAFSYSRIGVVRRHLTRCDFASDVERAPEATRLLRTEGGKIHVFWLTGFIFFGSSNGLFERVRHALETGEERDVRFVVLDFSRVSGFDTSAVLSLIKLRNLCSERGVTLAYADLSVTMLMALEHAGLFGAGQRHRAFPNRNEALAWCEEELLAEAMLSPAAAHLDGFERWLAAEVGSEGSASLVATYLERKTLAGGERLYGQGEPSDSIDLVASGSIAVTVADEKGRPLRVRRMAGQTVVGEMGFFRKTARTASVTAEAPSVVYTLDRARYERLLAEKPTLGAAFHQFIIRALADRVEFANQEIAALI